MINDRQFLLLIFKNVMWLGCSVESHRRSKSNKHPQSMFYEVIRKKIKTEPYLFFRIFTLKLYFSVSALKNICTCIF